MNLDHTVVASYRPTQGHTRPHPITQPLFSTQPSLIATLTHVECVQPKTQDEKKSSSPPTSCKDKNLAAVIGAQKALRGVILGRGAGEGEGGAEIPASIEKIRVIV